MRPFGQSNKPRRDWWLGLLAEGTHLEREFGDYLRLDNRRAGELTTAPAITATERMSVNEIADPPRRHGIKRVPVIRDGMPVGIVAVRRMARGPGKHRR